MVIDKKVLMGASAAAALLFSGPSYSQEANSELPYVMENGSRTDDLEKALKSWVNSFEFSFDDSKSFLKIQYAYVLGLTGKGVNLGLVDSGLHPNIPVLAGEGKIRSVDEGHSDDYGQNGFIHDRFKFDIHGSHVATTMVGNRDVRRFPFYGMAYNSTITSATANLYNEDIKWIRDTYFERGIIEPIKLLQTMLEQYPDVKVINNSWGSSTGLNYDDPDIEKFKRLAKEEVEEGGLDLEFLKKQNTIFVFAAGNIFDEDEPPHASIQSSIGLLDEQLRSKWISVTNIDTWDMLMDSFQCGHTATYCVSSLGTDVAGVFPAWHNDIDVKKAFWAASPYAGIRDEIFELGRDYVTALVGTYYDDSEEALALSEETKRIFDEYTQAQITILKDTLYDGLNSKNSAEKVTEFMRMFGYITHMYGEPFSNNLEFYAGLHHEFFLDEYNKILDELSESGYKFTEDEEYEFLTAAADTMDYIRASIRKFDDEYVFKLDGTSMAAPTVSGFLGLLAEYKPNYSAELLADIMLSSSRDLGDEEGVDIEYGWGLPQMDIALGGPTALRGTREVNVAIGNIDTWKHGIEDAIDRYSAPVLKNFSKDIGGINKIGGGELILLGNNTYTGPTTVSGGLLTVEGAIRNSNVQVNSGAMLSGTGQIFSLTATKDSVVAPGTLSVPYGTLTVLKDADFQTGSNLWVRVNPETQEYSKLNVLGSSNVSGLNVIVKANEGLWRLRTNMIVLSANDGIKGTVEGVKTDLAFLDPFVSYNANSVIVSLVRNDVKFEEFASNENDKIVARTLDKTFDQNSTNLQIVDFIMDTDHQTIRNLLPQLSGNLHANLASVASMEDRVIRNAMLGRTKSNSTQQNMIDKNLYAWAAVHAGDGAYDYSRHNKFEVRSTGLSAGLDYITDSAQFGVAISENKSKLERAYFSNNSSVKNTSIGVYGATNLQGFNLVVGTSISMLDFDANRTVSANSLSEKLMSDYSGDGWQVFGELSWPTVMLSANIDPYINYSYGTLEADFAENDKVAAMRGSVSSENHAVTIGLRGLKNITTPNRSSSIVSLVGDLSLTSNLNDDGTELRARIENSPEFVLKHEPIYKNAINAGVFINLQATNWAAFDVGYNGTYSDTYTDNRLFGRVTVKF